jgi:hypothetical protein
MAIATGMVIDRCYQQHTKRGVPLLPQAGRPRSPQGPAAHGPRRQRHPQAPNVRVWLQKHPAVLLHFVPTSCSWLKMVEIFFGMITRPAIRRGTVDSVKDPSGKRINLSWETAKRSPRSGTKLAASALSSPRPRADHPTSLCEVTNH